MKSFPLYDLLYILMSSLRKHQMLPFHYKLHDVIYIKLLRSDYRRGCSFMMVGKLERSGWSLFQVLRMALVRVPIWKNPETIGVSRLLIPASMSYWASPFPYKSCLWVCSIMKAEPCLAPLMGLPRLFISSQFEFFCITKSLHFRVILFVAFTLLRRRLVLQHFTKQCILSSSLSQNLTPRSCL